MSDTYNSSISSKEPTDEPTANLETGTRVRNYDNYSDYLTYTNQEHYIHISRRNFLKEKILIFVILLLLCIIIVVVKIFL